MSNDITSKWATVVCPFCNFETEFQTDSSSTIRARHEADSGNILDFYYHTDQESDIELLLHDRGTLLTELGAAQQRIKVLEDARPIMHSVQEQLDAAHRRIAELEAALRGEDK